MVLADSIKKLRRKGNLSQEKLAVKAGISLSNLQKIEQGFNTNPSLDILTAIAKVFGVKIDDLLK